MMCFWYLNILELVLTVSVRWQVHPLCLSAVWCWKIDSSAVMLTLRARCTCAERSKLIQGRRLDTTESRNLKINLIRETAATQVTNLWYRLLLNVLDSFARPESGGRRSTSIRRASSAVSACLRGTNPSKPSVTSWLSSGSGASFRQKVNKILLTKCSMWKEAGTVTSSYGWRRHSVTFNASGPAWRTAFIRLFLLFPSDKRAYRLSSRKPRPSKRRGSHIFKKSKTCSENQLTSASDSGLLKQF